MLDRLKCMRILLAEMDCSDRDEVVETIDLALAALDAAIDEEQYATQDEITTLIAPDIEDDDETCPQCGGNAETYRESYTYCPCPDNYWRCPIHGPRAKKDCDCEWAVGKPDAD